MKKYYFCFFLTCFFFTKVFSQEIHVKRYFLGIYPRYFAGEQPIGISTQQLIKFIEKTHSQDSLVMVQIRGSEKLSKIYPKIQGYSSLISGIGALGFTYVIAKGIGRVVSANTYSDPSVEKVANASLGLVAIGVGGIAFGGGCAIVSKIKLKKAINSYNKTFQKNKVVIDLQPFVHPNASGLTICLKL
jgi:hypothetical protein